MSASRRRPAIFLDRDGTIMVDVDYCRRPEDVVLLPGAGAALAALRELGYALVVVTNQSGMARGRFGEAELAAIHTRLDALLAESGARIDAYYVCPHLPEGVVKRYALACDCRKPLPGLCLRAAAELGLDLAASFAVGDRERDVEAGLRAGCRAAYLLATPPPATTLAHGVFASLEELVRAGVIPVPSAGAAGAPEPLLEAT